MSYNNNNNYYYYNYYNYEEAKEWIRAKERHFCLIVFVYVLLANVGNFLLSTQQKQNWTAAIKTTKTQKTSKTILQKSSLKTLLAVWNAILAAFSFCGFLRVSTPLWRAVQRNGLSYTYTQLSELQTDQHAGYWTFLWVLSKVPELLDTFFIVARGRQLRFMHWFHHAMSIFFGTINFVGDNAYLVWVVWMNFFIHALMYSYYLLTSLEIRPPRAVAQLITTLQIIQFLVILDQLAHVAFLQVLARTDCDISLGGFCIGLFTTSVYLKLWCDFYNEQYLGGLKKSGGERGEEENKRICLKRK